MNFDKNPRQARRLAQKQAALARMARREGKQLSGKERALVEQELIFDNFAEDTHEDEPLRDSREDGKRD